jgi:hypothetical protein
MYFADLIECPECGFHTHELTRATSMDDARGKVLMCDACHEDSEEGSNDEPFEQGFNF